VRHTDNRRANRSCSVDDLVTKLPDIDDSSPTSGRRLDVDPSFVGEALLLTSQGIHTVSPGSGAMESSKLRSESTRGRA
jgi:hypothetical protein